MFEDTKLRHLGLGMKLRDLRLERGMTTRSVAASLGISPSSVNRSELGQRLPGREEVSALCALYGVTGDDKALLMQRASEAKKSKAWLESSRGEADVVAALAAMEREASLIANIENALIPGLLQLPEYSRKLISLSTVVLRNPEERVAARLSRQAILSRPNAPTVKFFVDEGALHRTFGDSKMLCAQLTHILAVAERYDNVAFKVLPYSAAAHVAAEGAFNLYELPDGTIALFVEAYGFSVLFTDWSDVEPYVTAYEKVEAEALDREDSADLIRKVIAELGDTPSACG